MSVYIDTTKFGSSEECYVYTKYLQLTDQSNSHSIYTKELQ